MGRDIRRTVVGAMIGAVLPFITTVAVAHHAWNEIDTAKTMTLVGTVKALHWENPHSSLVLENSDKVVWTVMMSGIARMEGRGLKADTLATGKSLTIVASPSRDHPNIVRANRIRSDGKEYVLY